MFDELDNEESIKGIAGDPVFADPKLPKGYLSVSQVTQFLKCGEAYKRKYVDNEITASSAFMVQGRGVHKAAEALHLSMIGGSTISTEQMCDIYSDLHEKEMAEVPDVEQDPGVLKDEGISMTKNYRAGALGEIVDLDTGQRYPQVNPIAAEKVVRVVLRPEESEPVPFMGVIDLEEEANIADIKTKKRMASQQDTDNSIQLTLYAYITGKPSVRLDQLVKANKTRPTRYVRTSSVRTRKEALHVLDVVAEVADDIAAGRFRKTSPENWWCSEKSCPYWTTCRGRNR